MLEKYKHIIWDWNGTLLNDVWLCVAVINEMLKKRKLPVLTIERYQEMFDFPVKNYYERIGFDFQKEPFTIVGTEFIAKYDAKSRESKLHDFALSILKNAKNTGQTQSILSARKHQQLVEEIDFFEIKPYFDNIVGLDNHYAGSKVENGLQLISELNLPNEQIVLIGDTTHDYEVAESMNIDCILIANGHHPELKLKKCKASVIKNLETLF